MNKGLFIILGNQLFDPDLLEAKSCKEIYMAEDMGLCTFEKHHKLKIYLFLVAMREYRDELKSRGFKVHYKELTEVKGEDTYIDNLKKFIEDKKIKDLNFFEIEDKPFERSFKELETSKLNLIEHQSPMFLFSREEFKEFHTGKKVFRMASFYKLGRKKFNILIDKDSNPIGEKWSFDEENRKKIPKGTEIPSMPKINLSRYHDSICKLIHKYFDGHPGLLKNFWFPVTRQQASECFDLFLKERMERFGIYEDAMLSEDNFLFHSTISPALNMGLITPQEVINKVISAYEEGEIPLNSTEGFIRQVIGWREFIRGIYQEKSEFQVSQNYWKHKNKLTDSWYEGTTGIIPLDDCIKTTLKDGYHHHIPRLMIISNLMNMCEIDPNDIYKWFMEMYVDSSDWVMVPNVFGMATYADGGLMSTKPYTCGSNYMLKMSNYPKGEWCDVVDGLYWRFTEKHRAFYEKNARMNFLTRTLDRLNPERKKMIFSKAADFIETNTK